MKKLKAVLEAEAVARNKKAELDAAKEAMNHAKEIMTQLEKEWHAALAAVRDAQMAFDATLPQCRYVRVCRSLRNRYSF